MKLIFTVLLIFFSIHSFSQKNELSEAPSRATDSISSIEGSTIFCSLLKSTDSISLHSSDTINSSMFGRINTLDEVYINQKSEFNAVSLGILKKEIKPLTTNERRLYTAGDFKPIHLLSILGGSLAVDPIINAISGRTKRLKRYILIEKKESNIIYLEDHFMEYMVDNLNIKEQIIGRFLSYLVENEELQVLIDRKDIGALSFLIGDEWFKFKSFQNEPSIEIIDEVQKE